MDVFEAIQKRKSIRKFKPDPVSDDFIMKILAAGIQAPNAFNKEQWEFIIVKDAHLRGDIALMRQKIPPQKRALESAPILLVVCYNNELGADALATAFACIENIILAATAQGLGAVTLTFHGQKIKDILHIPQGIDVAAVIPMGYPDEDPVKPPRTSVGDKLHIDIY